MWTLLIAGLALAQNPPLTDELPPELPPIELERIPPEHSWELAVHFSYGDVAYWRGQSGNWIGLGVRGGWGKHFGEHRIGGSFGVATEGEVPVYYTIAFEPAATWDWTKGGLFVGASVGPTGFLHGSRATTSEVLQPSLGAHVASRIGWSQGWSRIGRRLFILIEPKLRIVPGPADDPGIRLNPVVALVVGSGRGY